MCVCVCEGVLFLCFLCVRVRIFVCVCVGVSACPFKCLGNFVCQVFLFLCVLVFLCVCL